MRTEVIKTEDSSCICHVVNTTCQPANACGNPEAGCACGTLCICGPTCPGTGCDCGCGGH